MAAARALPRLYVLTTVSPTSLLGRLQSVAAQSGTGAILDRLGRAALASTDADSHLLGVVVSFLAQRERIGILAGWSEESGIAADLDRLGRAAWSDVSLIKQLRPVGDVHLAAKVLRGTLESHYLVGMTAPRRALSRNANEDANTFVERLRLLLLIRAVEASDAGIPRESHLESLCADIRQICDLTEHSKWDWVGKLVHSVDDFSDFVSETERSCDLLLKTRGFEDASERRFLTALIAVLRRDFKAARSSRDAPDDTTGAAIVASRRAPWSSTAWSDLLEAGHESSVAYALGDTDDALGFVIATVDVDRPPPAQRVQGTGLILQSLEAAQYLRYSWHRLSEAEERAFFDRLQVLLGDANPVDRLGAALIGIAVLTSTPVSSVYGVPIRSDLQDDWALDLRGAALRRRPPRFARRWRAQTPDERRWIRPLQQEWKIDLTAEVMAPLREAAGSKRVKTMGDIWRASRPDEPLEAWFSSRFAAEGALERLTSPVVPTLLPQHVFEATQDHTLARLTGSNSRTGLPSACTYGAFSAAEVRRALAGAVSPVLGTLAVPSAADDGNAAGSEMDTDLAFLRRAILGLTAEVDKLAKQPDSLIEYHNRLTALCVVALLASTGARPVTSPFECLSWIDFERRLVYVEDKRSGPTRGSRACVLTDFAHGILTDCYLPHLSTIACALEPSAPKFAAEVRRVLSRDAECGLPLFFFLRAEPVLDWMEVSEAQLDLVIGRPWPLPWNVFRHLLSTQSRRRGLHPDVRDALLAHGDYGAESHGDFSWRIPREDFEAARPVINLLTAELGFRLPATSIARSLPHTRVTEPDLTVSRPFGRRARADRREKTLKSAVKTAKADIARALNGRLPSSLSSDAWEEIALRMLFRDDGVPHSMSSVRYQVFEDELGRLWREQGVHSRRHKRHVPLREAQGVFNEYFTEALEGLPERRQVFEQIVTAISTKDLGPVLAGCMAALELALHCRVDNFEALCAVTCRSASVRVVRCTQIYWLEWSYSGDWQDGRPVYRVPVTVRAANWIGASQAGKKALQKMPPVLEALTPLAKDQADFGGLLKKISTLVSQVNAFDLPGTMAAFLSGKRESSALPHADWIRTLHLEAPVARDATTPTDQPTDNPSTPDEHYFRHHHKAFGGSKDEALKRCRQLFDAIDQLLAQPVLPRKQGATLQSNPVKASPARLAAEIARLVKQSEFGSGDAPYVAAHYVHHLLRRPKKTNAGESLKVSTAQRYWLALKPGILDFAFDINLTLLDDEELTDLYSNIVTAARGTSLIDTTSAQDRPKSNARRRQVKSGSDAGHRTANELESFHLFARELYQLEDPDWAEISPGRRAGSGRPGIVLRTEYEAALSALVPDPSRISDTDELSLRAACVLLLCGRFGLRTGEAVGLQRGDWVEIATSVVVLVRSNAVRGLKTEQSKRQVPLIGELSTCERSVMVEALRRWELEDGKNRSTSLFPGVRFDTIKTCKREVSTLLLPLIKTKTGNSNSTVHHLRHGFACMLLMLLCGRSFGAGLTYTDDQATSARRLLIGVDKPDRRALWSVARLLGHASPSMTLKAYVHVLDQWIPTPIPSTQQVDHTDHRLVVNLDSLSRDAGYLNRAFKGPSLAVRSEPLALRCLHYLRLRQLGKGNAATASRLSLEQATHLDHAIQSASERVIGTSEERSTSTSILSGIADKRWKSLIKLVAAREGHLDGANEGDWLPTVGARRQVVLFLPNHFKWAAGFVRSLNLTEQECKLLHEPTAHQSLLESIQSTGLLTHSMHASDWHGGHFQIDRAVIGPPEQVFKDRAALVPVPTGRVGSRVELLVLWITWLVANSLPR